MEQVDEIYVRIMDVNDGDDDYWFSSDTVYVVGSLGMDELQKIMQAVKPNIYPDDMHQGWYTQPVNLTSSIPDEKVIAMWWD